MRTIFPDRLIVFMAATLFSLISLAKGEAVADVAVGYTATYANSIGGSDNVEVLAANTIAGANAIYERSGAPARMRVVGCYQSTQDNTNLTSTGGIVGWLSGNDSRISDVVTYGNNMGADLVTYICTNNDSASIGAVAQQPGRFSCFNPSSFWSTVFCHEAGGHNYGCDHRGGDDNPKTVMMHNYCGGGANGYFSNPNIWLNGSRLQGAGTCLGAAVDGGDNAYLLSNAAQGVADRNTRVVSAPSLGNVVRRWAFTQAAGGAAAGTTVTDSVSGTALATVQGTGATFTGSGLCIPGGAGGSGAAYLQLPGALISGYTNATVEIWAKTLSVQNWARLMDFNNGTGNYILLAAAKGTDLNGQRFESKLGTATVTLDSALPTVTGVMYHYAITFAANGAGGGRWTWYRDGDLCAYMDVAYALSALPDVNNWLGRSAYSSDSLANCEYAEVRVSNIAMSRTQVAANARLGPNRPTADANLTADDPIGQTSFNATGLWSNGLAPSAGKSYETYGFRLRTPADANSSTFAGQSLALNGGGLTWKGTSGSTTTINDLTLGGTDAELINAGSGTWTLAGNVKVTSPEVTMRAANGPINLSANLSGNGALFHLNNTVTISGTNTSFTGRTIVGDGRFSSIAIDSEARLGANPNTFTADQLTLNRGVFYTSTTMTIDDANRGIRIGESAGIFNVAAGTTLTLAVPLSSPSSGATLLTAPQYPNPVSGMLIKENSGTLNLTHANSSYIGEITINGGTLSVSGAGRINNGDTTMPVINNGTLQIDTTGNQSFGGVISGSGSLIKSSTGTTTFTAANTFTGAVTISGGTLYANAANAANGRALSFTSGITINSGATLRSSANALFGSDGTQEKPITVNTGGILLADGGASGDVGVGTVTLAGGTLSSTAASTAYGTWRFDDATDKLSATQDSTVSASNVKFGNAAATIDVASGKTLNFTGTITDATSGGISYLTKTGAGTLALVGINAFTGATAINAGTVKLSGSLAAGSTVTVAGGATLSGTGTVNGTLNFFANAVHAPGNPTGAQTLVGAVSYASTSHLKWALSTNSVATNLSSRVSARTVAIAAGSVIDLVLNGTGTTVDFTNSFWKQSQTWTVMSGTSISGSFALGTVSVDSGSRVASNYGVFALQQSATAVLLTFTPSYENWQRTNFGASWNDPAIAGDTVDGDKDGLSNLLEYAMGTNPNASSQSTLQSAVSGGYETLYVDKNTAATNISWDAEVTGDLQTWQPAVIIANTGTVFQARDSVLTSDATKRFIRLKLSRP